MGKRRVVITGLGTINAVGHNVNETWENLIAGKCGIGTISRFELTEDYASRIAGEIKNYDPKEHFDRKRIKKLDPYTQYALIAAKQALEDADLINAKFDHDRAGVIMGSGIGGMLTFEQESSKFILKGPKRVSPFFVPKMISNIGVAEIAIDFNLRGINFNTVSACASANHALGTAFRTIQYGDADIIVSGGAEGAVTPLTVAGFSAMKALSTRNDEPEKACRPFDKERDGFIMAEGAGVLVLEELKHAQKRGAKIYAEIVGYGATSDAFHITAPAENGEGGARAAIQAIKDAGIKPEEVDYVNAHGTSTPLNDKNETAMFKTVFGNYAYRVKINSTKSMIGHALGAAAGIEGIVCCKTIKSGIIHPTINQEVADPECDLDYVPNKAIKHDVKIAISNALGFGGHNSVIVFKKYSE